MFIVALALAGCSSTPVKLPAISPSLLSLVQVTFKACETVAGPDGLDDTDLLAAGFTPKPSWGSGDWLYEIELAKEDVREVSYPSTFNGSAQPRIAVIWGPPDSRNTCGVTFFKARVTERQIKAIVRQELEREGWVYDIRQARGKFLKNGYSASLVTPLKSPYSPSQFTPSSGTTQVVVEYGLIFNKLDD